MDDQEKKEIETNNPNTESSTPSLPSPGGEEKAGATEKTPEEVQHSAEDSTKSESPKAEGKTSEVKVRREAKKELAQEEGGPEFLEKVIKISRVTKVTKGGKKLSFSALVVVGDTKGRVGYALGKAPEVADAIRKALALAKKNMVEVSLKGTTITHEIVGRWGGSEVLLKPAREGTGVIASGPVRAICDAAGIHNILTKCHRSNNPVNVIKATMDGLMRLKTTAVYEIAS